jgi:hypothetical protein
MFRSDEECWSRSPRLSDLNDAALLPRVEPCVIEVTVDGVYIGEFDAIEVTDSDGNTTVTIGARSDLPAGTETDYFDRLLRALAIIVAVLTSAERQGVEADRGRYVRLCRGLARQRTSTRAPGRPHARPRPAPRTARARERGARVRRRSAASRGVACGDPSDKPEPPGVTRRRRARSRRGGAP